MLNPWHDGDAELTVDCQTGLPLFLHPFEQPMNSMREIFLGSPQKSELCTSRLGFGPFAVVIREEEENFNVKRNQNGQFSPS